MCDSDEAGSAGGHVSSWDTEDLDTSTAQSHGSSPSPLLLSPLQDEEPTVDHYSKGQSSSRNQQHQSTEQHVHPVPAPTHWAHTEQHCPTQSHWGAHSQEQGRVGPPAALQLLDASAAAHTVHVLDGRAEQLFEQHGQGQEAQSGAHSEAPFPQQAGGGGQEPHSSKPQAQNKSHRGAVTEQGLTRVSEPPQLHLLIQDTLMEQLQVGLEVNL